MVYDALILPFLEFAFMQRALAGAVMLSLSACPVGVFLTLRRMSLTAMPWRTPSYQALPQAFYCTDLRSYR